MGAIRNIVTLFGLVGILVFLLIWVTRYLGWTWPTTPPWLTLRRWRTREEKIALTDGGVSNSGFMITSDPEKPLHQGSPPSPLPPTPPPPPPPPQSQPLETIQQSNFKGSNGISRNGSLSGPSVYIPPQPLRPAPVPPPQLRQSDNFNHYPRDPPMDSLFTSMKGTLPPPPSRPPTSSGLTNTWTQPTSTFPQLSATNPFLPLLQASTNFINSKFQAYQEHRQGSVEGQKLSIGEMIFSSSGNSVPPKEEKKPELVDIWPAKESNVEEPPNQENGTSSMSGNQYNLPRGSPPNWESRDSGEGLHHFRSSSPPPPLSHSIQVNPHSFDIVEPERHLSNSGRIPNNEGGPPARNLNPFLCFDMEEPKVIQEEVVEKSSTSPRDSDDDALSAVLLESMREEIRIEKERMTDATRSLMEDFGEILEGVEFHGSKEKTFPSKAAPGPSSPSLPAPLQPPPPPLQPTPIYYNAIPPSNGNGKPEQTFDLITSAYNNNNNNNGGYYSNSIVRRAYSLRQSSIDSVGSEDLDGPPDGPPGLLRAMSCDSVSSDSSLILNDFEPSTPNVTGLLCIGLEYDSETADLLVNVIEGKEMVGLDPDPSAPFDTYVRVFLLPDKSTNMQTRVYRKSLNPVYKEKFMFGVEESELATRTLVFYLYATNKFSNTLIGEAELRLSDLNVSVPGQVTTWISLTDMGQRGGELGEIMFSLSYLPTAERLTVVIVKARNLKFPHEGGQTPGDPFVKVYLLQRGKKVSKKKSCVKKGERNPIFNEAMIFSVPAHALTTIQLRITMADSSEFEGRAYSIGHVIIGSSATGKSHSHWSQMLQSLRKPIAMWHPLKK